MTVLRVDSADPDPEDVALAAAALAAGQLVVVPTDSVYGLAADPALPAAVARLFEAKGRPRSLAIPVLVSSLAHVKRLVEVDARALRAIDRFWPGPLTLVLPRRPGAEWDLGGAWGGSSPRGVDHPSTLGERTPQSGDDAPGTLAVRMPDHPIALALLTQTGPLAVTSANRSGEAPPPTVAEIESVFGDAVSVYLDAGASPGATASTVVDLTGPEVRILRPGPVSAADLSALERAR